MVEAGGIEPPSRDVSADASTCVVRCLLSPRRAPADRIPRLLSRTQCLTASPSGEGRLPARCGSPAMVLAGKDHGA